MNVSEQVKIASQYYHAAEVCRGNGDYAKAVENYENALSIGIEIDGENHSPIVFLHKRLGECR